MQQTVAQWQMVFWICVPVYFLSEVFYLLFASASVQAWNFAAPIPSENETTEEEKQEQAMTALAIETNVEV